MKTNKHVWIHGTGVCVNCDVHASSAEASYECKGAETAHRLTLPYVSEFLHGSADTFAQRNAVYKDNYKMVGEIMKALFPKGIKLETPEDHNKFHLFMLAIVKLSRYAINFQTGHKDSVEDLIVYMAMVQALDAEAEEAKNGQGG